MHILKHVPYIINIQNYDLSDKSITMDKGLFNLRQILEKDQSITLEQKKKWMFQLVIGMYYMNQIGIWHRDLKPSNIVLMKDGQLRIIDFGLSRMGPHEDVSASHFVYTLWYRSPELIINNLFHRQPDYLYNGEKCEVWSLGIVFLDILNINHSIFRQQSKEHLFIEMCYTYSQKQLCESKTLYPDIQKICHSLFTNKKLRSRLTWKLSKYKSQYSIEIAEKQNRNILQSRLREELGQNDMILIDLLSKMLDPEPTTRISLRDIILHPFFSNEKKQVSITRITKLKYQQHKCTFDIRSDSVDVEDYILIAQFMFKIHTLFQLKIVTLIQGLAIFRFILQNDPTITLDNIHMIASIAMQISINCYEPRSRNITIDNWLTTMHVTKHNKESIKQEFLSRAKKIIILCNGHFNILTSYTIIKNDCEQLETMNELLYCVVLLDVLGYYYTLHSDEKVVTKAIEIYNNPSRFQSTPEQKDMVKEWLTLSSTLFFRENRKHSFCL